MTRNLISSGAPSEQRAGYSRAVAQGDWCFVAGTTAYNSATGTIPEDVVEQTRDALSNIAQVLAEAGFTLSDIVRANYYITDQTYWNAITPVLGEVFGQIRPAATCLIAGLVRPEMKIEIEVTALRRSA